MMQPFVFSCWLSLWHEIWFLQLQPKKTKEENDASVSAMFLIDRKCKDFSSGYQSLCVPVHKTTKCCYLHSICFEHVSLKVKLILHKMLLRL